MKNLTVIFLLTGLFCTTVGKDTDQKPKPKPTAQVAAKVKCPYCGTMNVGSAKSCTSCKGNLDFASYPKAVRLTMCEDRDIQVCWGPNGKIAFTCNKQGDAIWIMNEDGSSLSRLPVADSVGDFRPSWASNGKIAFSGGIVSQDIFIMDADGSNRKRLWDYSSTDTCPSMNADGMIVFASDRGRNSGNDLWVFDSNGQNEVQLTKEMGNNYNPCWSPDGKKIAFESDRGGNWDIYVMDADGKNVTKITKGAAAEYDASWGPDGRIAYVMQGKDSSEIMIMNADGTGSKMLTNNKWDESFPALGVNGKLLFTSRRASLGLTEDIYLMKVPK